MSDDLYAQPYVSDSGYAAGSDSLHVFAVLVLVDCIVVWVAHGTNCGWWGQPVIDLESPRTTMRSHTNRNEEIMHD